MVTTSSLALCKWKLWVNVSNLKKKEQSQAKKNQYHITVSCQTSCFCDVKPTWSSGWCRVISSSASLWAGSSHSSWISRSSRGTVSQRPQLAASWCTSSYWPGSAKLSRVCLPWVKHSLRLLQTVPWTPSQASPASGPSGNSLSPRRQLSSW